MVDFLTDPCTWQQNMGAKLSSDYLEVIALVPLPPVIMFMVVFLCVMYISVF